MSDNFKKNLDLSLSNAKRLSNKILINGKLTSAKSSNKIKVINPSTGELIGETPQCDKDDVDTAVSVAESAFHEWKKNSSKRTWKNDDICCKKA